MCGEVRRPAQCPLTEPSLEAPSLVPPARHHRASRASLALRLRGPVPRIFRTFAEDVGGAIVSFDDRDSGEAERVEFRFSGVRFWHG